jgi:glycosyltransferase involved in cell wall biosynthesis
MSSKKQNNSILIISHNSLSAGTSTQAINFINHLNENSSNINFHFVLPRIPAFSRFETQINENLKLHYVPYSEGVIGYVMRIFIEVFFVPYLILKIRPGSIFALTNYFLIPGIKIKKVVLLRHPYLLDESLTSTLSFSDKIKEFFRRQLFNHTLNLVDHLIVQSDYMEEVFRKKFSFFKKGITVLPNPVNSEKLQIKNISHKQFPQRENILFYPSRYYPHKNHEFLLDLVKKYHTYFLKNEVRFIITLNHEKETKHLLKQIQDNKLDDVIQNIGEVPQKELVSIYTRCKILFFPSNAETFGNALVEGLFFNLPIVVPDLPYAKTICGDAGSYYLKNNTEQAFNLIEKIITNQDVWEHKSYLASIKKEKYINIQQWSGMIINILTK